ncbi:helix-turn-helix transcriptional regulator [Paractinoplanes maris]|uniref:helix-turn-helix transcriptional regulator n=1 Tax=Paractinoplanes maris TaxID=1734446 RepID=UPI00202016C2|nr:helix-turn-helix transcriptional regulator [Actinoplanes maris]
MRVFTGSTGSAGQTMLDRHREREVLGTVLATVRAGGRAVLTVRGGVGVGKTRLLRHLEETASDFTVTRTSGSEPERELAYAGLQLMCAPMQSRLHQLPPPQREALNVAFGLSAGKVPDRFLVGLAVLGLMAAEAESRPLLCLVDDVQWLDQASVETLIFVARRLMAEPVALVFAYRNTADPPGLTGLPMLEVSGLGDADAQELLVTAVPGRIDQRVRDRIVAESRGNPLALLELPRGLSQVELAGGYRTPSSGPLVGSIESSYLRRLEQLPPGTRLLLLLASAEPVGYVPLLWRAAARLSVGVEDAEPAIADGMVEIDARVRFAHPLLRSVIYRAASVAERQRVHRVLADETDASDDPDRRAWHRAQAATAPDEDVAAELVRSAGRAQARGGLAAAAAFLEHAGALTPDPAHRARRMLSAARAKLLAGAAEAGLSLLSAAESGPLSALDRARAELLRGQIAFASSRGRDAPALLLKAAKSLEYLDAKRAGETYLETLSASCFAGRLAADGAQREVAMAARGAVRAPDQPAAIGLLLEGLSTRVLDGYVAAAPVLRQSLAAFQDLDLEPDEELRWLWLAVWVAMDLWDDESWYDLTIRQLSIVRETGALGMLPMALSSRIFMHLFSGELPEGESLMTEALTAAEAMQIQMFPSPQMLHAALRGHRSEGREVIETFPAYDGSNGEGFDMSVAAWTHALLDNGVGHYEDALTSARFASAHAPDLGASTWPLPEQIEAGVRGTSRESAIEAQQRLTTAARATGTDWALGVDARCRALLSTGPEAEVLFREAIDRLGRTRMKVDLARAHLLFGEWLRRADRRREARAELQIAHEFFSGIKAEGFAGRAARELEAADGVVRAVTTSPVGNLTPQELQIATLARDGYTNPEIGTRLFISSRTVEWHLSRVFPKLGITTRRALRDAFPASTERPPTEL